MQNVGTVERVASMAAGAAAIAVGIVRRDAPGTVLSVVGSVLFLRGAGGYCPINQALGRDTAHTGALSADVALTVQGDPHAIYDRWRDLQRLPEFMRHVERVEHIEGARYRWTVRIPQTKRELQWDAEITRDDGNVLAWRSVEGSSIKTSGEVTVGPDGGDRGTELRANLHYAFGDDRLKQPIHLLSPALEIIVKQDLRRFKSWFEAGEAPTVVGQPRA